MLLNQLVHISIPPIKYQVNLPRGGNLFTFFERPKQYTKKNNFSSQDTQWSNDLQLDILIEALNLSFQ